MVLQLLSPKGWIDNGEFLIQGILIPILLLAISTATLFLFFVGVDPAYTYDRRAACLIYVVVIAVSIWVFFANAAKRYDGYKKFIEFWLNPKGRMSIMEFWLLGILIPLLIAPVSFMASMTTLIALDLEDHVDNVLTGLRIIYLVIAAAAVWILFVSAAKRYRARGKEGRWALIGLVPIGGLIWIIIECGMLPGDNRAYRFYIPIEMRRAGIALLITAVAALFAYMTEPSLIAGIKYLEDVPYGYAIFYNTYSIVLWNDPFDTYPVLSVGYGDSFLLHLNGVAQVAFGTMLAATALLFRGMVHIESNKTLKSSVTPFILTGILLAISGFSAILLAVSLQSEWDQWLRSGIWDGPSWIPYVPSLEVKLLFYMWRILDIVGVTLFGLGSVFFIILLWRSGKLGLYAFMASLTLSIPILLLLPSVLLETTSFTDFPIEFRRVFGIAHGVSGVFMSLWLSFATIWLLNGRLNLPGVTRAEDLRQSH